MRDVFSEDSFVRSNKSGQVFKVVHADSKDTILRPFTGKGSDRMLRSATLGHFYSKLHIGKNYTPTIEDAREWEDDEEKFVYCLNALDASAWDRGIDEAVDDLESIYEQLLA